MDTFRKPYVPFTHLCKRIKHTSFCTELYFLCNGPFHSIQVRDAITANWARLVDDLDVAIFEHLLHPFLQGSVKEAETKRSKARALLHVLCRSPDEHIKRFCLIIAGLYPSLFKKIMGRDPDVRESGIMTVFRIYFLDFYTESIFYMNKR